MREACRTVHWGIVGTGAIARAFAEGLRQARGAVLWAVGSRSAEKARRFAETFGARRAYGSYAELAADPDVDVLYIATPHALHMEHTLMGLDAGKAVLCEKPFALNAVQADQMVRRARERKLFLMEAMWTRFLPAVRTARDWLRAGRIGALRMAQADFGFRADPEDEPKLLDPA
ncbi:MAG TPA: Gfo/Idh/MocA family oxidoreductase, partial [Candidatus Hydrogenedentes bacterium]|nr:Gfo/Idh/MocA family oxidoreductase [Candidatus Hydrogenedentota bacterium]